MSCSPENENEYFDSAKDREFLTPLGTVSASGCILLHAVIYEYEPKCSVCKESVCRLDIRDSTASRARGISF